MWFLLYPASSFCNGWTAEWVQLKPKQNIEPARSGHVAFTIKDEVYVFGGYAEVVRKDGEVERYPTNDLWKFAPAETTWKLLEAADLYVDDCDECNESTQAPQQRLAAAASTLADSAFIFGGWDPQTPGTGGVILDSIAEYSASKGGWMGPTLSSTSLEETTSRHVTVSISDDTVLLHNHRCTDHVLLFQKGSTANDYSLHRQPTKGTGPSPRGLHAACKLGDDTVVVFAGAAQDQTMSNEVFVLNLSSWTWKKLDSTTSSTPVPRASPCICALDDTTCIVFGGATPSATMGLEGLNDLWLMKTDIDKGSVIWEKFDVTGSATIPPGRNAATLMPVDLPGVENCQCFLLSGGWAPFVKTHNDSFVLKMSPEDRKSVV